MVRRDSELGALLDRFVCARVVSMQGIDLGQFQFDYDLTLAVVFLNADGRVYGRYGARREGDAMALNSARGLARAMERVLELHAAYPANRQRLAGKLGPEPRYRRAGDIPVPPMAKRRGKVTEETCIHCHQVHEAEQDLALARGGFDPEDFAFRYPPPSQLGLTIDRDDGRRVTAVEGDTVAQRAGIVAGDEILELGGQPIVSIADIVWVLHRAGEGRKLAAVVLRDGKRRVLTLDLYRGWRRPTLAWRASMYAMPPRPGLWVEEVEGYDKARLGVPKAHVALRVRGLFRPAVRRSGLRTGDVIVAYDDQVERATPGRFHAYLRLHFWRRRAKLALEVLRDGERKKIAVRF